jgi:hypothetical protein
MLRYKHKRRRRIWRRKMHESARRLHGMLASQERGACSLLLSLSEESGSKYTDSENIGVKGTNTNNALNYIFHLEVHNMAYRRTGHHDNHMHLTIDSHVLESSSQLHTIFQCKSSPSSHSSFPAITQHFYSIH